MEDPWADPSLPQNAVAPIKAAAEQTADNDGFTPSPGPTFDSSAFASSPAADDHVRDEASIDVESASHDDDGNLEGEDESDAYAGTAAIPSIEPVSDGDAVDGFDDFDDFDEPAQAGPSGTSGGIVSGGTDDDFGDFDDFEDAPFEPAPLMDEPMDSRNMAVESIREMDRDFVRINPSVSGNRLPSLCGAD